MAFFDFSSSFKKFREEDDVSKKALYGALAVAKGVGNISLAVLSTGMKSVLKNPNSTPEQREKAEEFLKKYDK